MEDLALMKKEDAIKNFVRRYYRILYEKESFDRTRYKDLKRVYFGKELQHKFGIPRDKEICNFLVDFLIKTQRISDKETLEKIISESPFLKMSNIRADDYTALMDLVTKKYAIKEDMQGLKEVERIEKQLEWI